MVSWDGCDAELRPSSSHRGTEKEIFSIGVCQCRIREQVEKQATHRNQRVDDPPDHDVIPVQCLLEMIGLIVIESRASIVLTSTKASYLSS